MRNLYANKTKLVVVVASILIIGMMIWKAYDNYRKNNPIEENSKQKEYKTVPKQFSKQAPIQACFFILPKFAIVFL